MIGGMDLPGLLVLAERIGAEFRRRAEPACAACGKRLGRGNTSGLCRQHAMSERWQDPEFRARNAEAVRAHLSERWQDPEFRARQAEAVRAHFIAREQGFMAGLDDDAVLVFAAARDDGVPCEEAREVAIMDMQERGAA
jgi:hypothetical protein